MSDQDGSDSSANEKGRSFETRVGNLFALMGFSVKTDVLIAGRQVDLLLEDRQAPLSRTYIVECKDQAMPVGANQYDAFRGRLHAAKHAMNPRVRGIIVSSVGFTREVKAQSEFDDVELLTIGDIETSLIDFRGYVRNLTSTLQDDITLHQFVEPEAIREPMTTGMPITELFEEWLTDPQANQLTLLGDYGTGKTTVLKYLASTLAKRYDEQALQSGARVRVPIFIDLRDYIHAVSLKTIVLDLLDSQGIRASSYAAFEHLSREGQLVVFLDSFDEMASRGNFEATLKNFRDLNRGAVGRAKFVLACRTHYFVNIKQLHRYLGTSQRYTPLYSEIAMKPNFQIVYLQEFDQSRVRRYLDLRCGVRASQVASFIENTYNLQELSRRPVLLDMIVASEQSIQRGAAAVTPGMLYQTYTDIWLVRNDWSTVIDVDGKCELLERLAYEIEQRPNYRLSYRDIPQLIRSWKESVDEAGLREIDAELRRASFLVWAGDGTYAFSHRSFQEYFLAAHLIAEAVRGETKPWSQALFRSEVYRFIRDLLARREDAARVLVAWISRSDLNAICRGNAIKCASVVLGQETRAALLQLLVSDESDVLRRYAATGLGYHPDVSSVSALVDAVKHDPDPLLRRNALLALGRIGSPGASQALLELLHSLPSGTDLKAALTALFYREAKAFKDDNLVAFLITKSMDFVEERFLLFSTLELCQARWSPEAQAYCEKVAQVTDSARGFAQAVELLPPKLKIRYLHKALKLIQECIRMPIAEKVIRAMRGMGNAEEALPLLVGIARHKSSRNAVAALDVLFADFPASSREVALDLLGQPHVHLKMRIRILDGIAPSANSDEFDRMASAVLSKRRVAVQIHFLQLCRTYCPKNLTGIILQHWDGQATPVKGQMIEILWLSDRISAKGLIIDRGLRDSHIGTRVAAVRTLGADASKESTAALLWQAGHDDSKWVRVQAVRSLIVPGRTLPVDQLRKEMQNETDAEVLQVRRELLGW